MGINPENFRKYQNLFTLKTEELASLVEDLQEELDMRFEDDDFPPYSSPSLEDEGKSLGSYKS